MTDDERETAIKAAYEAMCTAITPRERERHHETMCELIRGRSAEQVARMERQQGLTACGHR